MKKKLICILCVTFVLLTGCSEKQEVKATDNSETVITENEYREYDIYDYSDVVPNIISFYDTDNSSYMGNEVEDMDGLRVIFKKDILSEVDISSQESLFGSTISFIEKYFPSYVFGDENGVDIYYISMQDEYAYFKINIDNASQLLQNFSSYSIGDDVYMIVSGGLKKNTSGELGMKFNYFIKNFSLDEISGDTALNDDEMTYADWSTLCTEKTIQTELYSVTVPDTWINKCSYEISENGWDITFTIPGGYDGVNDSTLCTIAVVNGSLDDVFTPYTFIETIESEWYGRSQLILEYPGDMQYTEDTEKEYLLLANEINQLVDSITLADGVEVISTIVPNYDMSSNSSDFRMEIILYRDGDYSERIMEDGSRELYREDIVSRLDEPRNDEELGDVIISCLENDILPAYYDSQEYNLQYMSYGDVDGKQYRFFYLDFIDDLKTDMVLAVSLYKGWSDDEQEFYYLLECYNNNQL